MSDDARTYLFPSIIGRAKTGKATEWLITVRIYASLADAQGDRASLVITGALRENKDLDGAYVARILVYYRVGEDGKAQKKVPTYVTEGKREGCANQTNVLCQALRDAFGLYNKHLRRSGGERETAILLPMLARPYADIYGPDADPSPLYVQRKYNGVRAIGAMIDGEPRIYSRKGLFYDGFSALRDELAMLLGCARGVYLDGELYKHGCALPVISGIVRRVSSESAQNDLSFVVYDLFIVDEGAHSSNELPFSARLARLREIAGVTRPIPHIQFAETFECAGSRAIDRAMVLYARFLAEGYEGAIVRANARYVHSENDHHSDVLLKIKPVRDEEYKIVDYTTGRRGKAADALLFVCALPDNTTFTVTPTGTVEARKTQVREFARVEANGETVFANHWRGRMLSVFFDELSPKGVPQRARTNGEIRTCA